MKKQIILLIFGIIFGVMIGISVPHATAKPLNSPEVMEIQSGKAAGGKINWSTMVVNGKKLTVFSAESDSGCIYIELYW